MKKICFYFQVHQPFRLRTYRFFDIGRNHDYYDGFANQSIMRKVAEKCYLPMNQLLLDLIQKYEGRFKVAFSISGVAIDQMEMYAPDVLESFKKLAKTGYVEFLAETYAHSLASLTDRDEFNIQVQNQVKKVEEHFNQTPAVFRNTELIYSDHIGEIVADMGYKGMLTEGAKHIMAWKSPNYVYTNTMNPRLKLLLKNFQMSDDIAFRFSNRDWEQWPLTTEKYVEWLRTMDGKEEIVNLFMDYETFGEHQWAETGIFNFMRALPEAVFRQTDMEFVTPSEAIDQLQPVGHLHIPEPISWADEERDLTAWLGNELQDDAFEQLYALWKIVRASDEDDIIRDWRYLQTSDHFYYMCTKWFSDGDVHKYFNPYSSPYEAYINFMNILSDFKIRLGDGTEEKSEVERLRKLTEQQDAQIRELNKEIGEIRRNN
ncbi:Membrane-anchored protein predicted to be involved in regulation of amylopullulanase [Salinivirga cyanobacteriivorans]|uniref:Membrane-anchored protein predicted to be involved in regulation of amylopullulanase n=1 Tax=Salinivirga cyanobacteriivorans TaxID=1307839 RepID=A0A0S2HVH2_9BACT|nr:glycoside hydrolase family 57 protein [Salinivirga cyanobacteriivorans]ALO13988.1 Membrane-anchored protein predicted to be involved in regulation of amylopullulanase [Salinivirga cyanobacteriivorans]